MEGIIGNSQPYNWLEMVEAIKCLSCVYNNFTVVNVNKSTVMLGLKKKKKKL